MNITHMDKLKIGIWVSNNIGGIPIKKVKFNNYTKYKVLIT